jgi:phosphatidate cytidylyltransferase
VNNFLTRAITGTLFVVVMVSCIWYSYWSMAFLFLGISILGLWEFYSLLEKTNHSPQKYTGTIIGSTFIGAFLLLFQSVVMWKALEYLFLLLFASLMCIFFIELFRKKDVPFENIAFTILGILYISFSFMFIASGSLVDMNNYNPHLILGFFFLVWSNDTFAYLVGRAIGKHKLFERISPKKTWEGAIGGGILTIGIGYIISIYFTEIAPLHWLVIAFIVAVTATLGDLVESMFKRSINVKDSGSILPGHGGILDRFDGVLLSSPFVFTYLILIR